ncbi:MAG: hypothetical protein EOM92_19460 [Gammaproteobacteria bacterium]|nr:hypothetical protein [Gammaproteobacteria bacterium]
MPAKAASPPSRQVAPTTWPGFDAFWGAYPAKKAKQDALKAWNKLRLPPGDVDAIQADLPLRLATDRSWREGYIPNPATYLNGRRWEDAITPIQAVRPGGRVVSLAERNQAVLDRFVNGGSEFGDFIEGECRHA